jgi:hypothetical protein
MTHQDETSLTFSTSADLFDLCFSLVQLGTAFLMSAINCQSVHTVLSPLYGCLSH